MSELNAAERAFRDVWSRFATGVTVITTVEPDGAVHGMTANGVTSVSLEPQLMLACVGHERNTHGLIRSTGRFGVSILSAGQELVARHFTLPPERRPAAGAPMFVRVGSSPAVAGAVAAMDCRVVSAYEQGDHTVFIAEVEAHDHNDSEPLVWYRGQFGRFKPRNSVS